MTNKLSTLLAFSAIGMSFAALPAFGGDTSTLHVNVPFSFTAGKTVMPAGEYTVYENDAHLLTIRGVKSAVMVLAAPGTESDSETSALSFERTGKGFSLRTVRAAGRPSSVVPATLGEK
jgi:hypothetical protein